MQDLAWERYYDLKPSELGDLIRMPKYGKALVSAFRVECGKVSTAAEHCWLAVEGRCWRFLLG